VSNALEETMRIQYREGVTRRVLVLGKIAVKIPKIGFSHCCNNLFRATKDRVWLSEKLSHSSPESPSLCVKIARHIQRVFSLGINANRQECLLSQKYPDMPFARVHCAYLWGYILVMQRAEQVTEEECDTLRIRFNLPEDEAVCDLGTFKNIGKIGGRPVFVDYGHPSVPMVLELV
jgi:hypothetical protein